MMKKIAIAGAVVAVCAIAYLALAQRPWIESLLGLDKPAVQEQASGQNAGTDPDQPEKLSPQAQQERIAQSVAQQQAVVQQANQAALQSATDVQRTLKTIEEINRMNRMNQQMRQNQPSK